MISCQPLFRVSVLVPGFCHKNGSKRPFPYHILFAEIVPLKLWKTFKATDSFFFKVNAMGTLKLSSHDCSVERGIIKHTMTDYTRSSPPNRSRTEHRITLLLVFSVTPFKINQNQNQNSSNDKVQNLEEKEGKYAKTFARIQVTVMFLTQDMRRNFLPKFTEILMETPCCRLSEWRPGTNRNICH